MGLRCQDCYGGGLYCVGCCLEIHSRHPFHRIQVCWMHVLLATVWQLTLPPSYEEMDWQLFSTGDPQTSRSASRLRPRPRGAVSLPRVYCVSHSNRRDRDSRRAREALHMFLSPGPLRAAPPPGLLSSDLPKALHSCNVPAPGALRYSFLCVYDHCDRLLSLFGAPD